MGYLIYYIEGPLLWFTLILAATLIIARSILAFSTIFIGINRKHFDCKRNFSTFFRLLLPYHKSLAIKPVYFISRFIYHGCLFAVPIWFSGHIVLWEESKLEWTWTPLSDLWIDWMTLAVLLLSAFFLLKRWLLKHKRFNATKSDYFLLIATGLPFLTGYCLTHQTLDSFPLVDEYLYTAHIFSGEVFLMVVCFLFYETNLNALKCIGCLACTVNCPTGTLVSHDNQRRRKISYSHYQCICCGGCAALCPYEAAEIRHAISFIKFFQIGRKYEIQRLDLKACRSCGNFFIPLEQFRKIRLQNTESYICLCPACKQISYAESLCQAPINRIRPKPD